MMRDGWKKKRVRERNWFQLWKTESKCPDDSCRDLTSLCRSKEKCGFESHPESKDQGDAAFLQPLPPCSWANWDHASLRDINRMWALKWSWLPHRVIIRSLVFSAKEWIQGCIRLLCATEPHPPASVGTSCLGHLTSQPSTAPPLCYLSFRTWVTALGALISCRILHILCVWLQLSLSFHRLWIRHGFH